MEARAALNRGAWAAARAALLVASMLTVGCLEAAPYRCARDADCVRAGSAVGVCEPTFACSFGDTSCASGKRYAAPSGELTGQCVGDGADLSVGDLTEPDLSIGGESRCPLGKFCDGFETSVISAKWAGGVPPLPGTIMPTTDEHLRGRQAVHFHTDPVAPKDGGAGSSVNLLLTEDTFPTMAAAAGPFWVRVFFKAPKLFVDKVTLVGVSQTPYQFQLQLRALPGGLLQLVHDSRGAVDSEHTYPENEWVCVEWRIDQSAPSMQLYVNGAHWEELDNTFEMRTSEIKSGTEKWRPLGIVSLSLYYYLNAPNRPTDVYFDEVAIDTERVGCDR